MLSPEITAAIKEIRLKAENLMVEARLSKRMDRGLHPEAVARELEAALKKLEKVLDKE